MKEIVLLAAIGLLLLFTGLMLLAGFFSTGEYLDLAVVFADYMPGKPVPDGLECQYIPESYVPGGLSYCRITTVLYCRGGFISVERDVIRWFSLYGCRLPLGLIVAQYGRWNRERRLRYSRQLMWENVYALMKPARYTMMSTVSYVRWRS